MKGEDYKKAAQILNDFIVMANKRVFNRQQLADEQSRAIMSNYILSNGSVSGINYDQVLSKLAEIKTNWLTSASVYNYIIGLNLTKLNHVNN